jgi:hypothetical protein
MINFSKSAQRKLFAILALTTVGLMVAPSRASAFNLVNRTGFTDNDFESLRTKGEFTELFVAEGRIGDRGSNATHEIDILGDTKKSFTPVEKSNYDWGNNTPVAFSLEYTGSQVKYIVGNKTLSTTQFNSNVTDIFLRTFANLLGSKSTLSDLVFNGTDIGNLGSAAVTTGDTDYLQITGISAPFMLTGKTSFDWTGSAPRNSNLAYQIKVGTSPTSVPEPGMVAAIVVAGASSLVSKRKKQSAHSTH